jgi:hypothetical protein
MNNLADCQESMSDLGNCQESSPDPFMTPSPLHEHSLLVRGKSRGGFLGSKAGGETGGTKPVGYGLLCRITACLLALEFYNPVQSQSPSRSSKAVFVETVVSGTRHFMI